MAKQKIDWYIVDRGIYEQHEQKVESIPTDLFNDAEIECHDITSRAKTIERLSAQLNNSKYDQLKKQITCLARIRIITYVEDGILILL